MSVKQWIKRGFVLGLFATSNIASASIQSDLESFFNKMGGGSNFSSGAVVKGQQAGYLVGGSMYVRTPVRTLNLISVTIPTVNAGCGGIDAYFGAFSFVNREALQQMAKNIMSNAMGYAFNLALETTCPQCKAVLDTIQSTMNEVNLNNKTTCQAAQGLVNGIASRTWLRDYDQCLKLAQVWDNKFSDWSAAARGCSNTGGDMDNILNAASNRANDKDRVSRNTNITWDAFNDIKQVISNDRELKEILMTMVGTTIYGSKSGDFQHLPTMGATNELIHTLMYGGETQIYLCDEATKCLKPTVSKITLRGDQAIVYKIKNILYRLMDKRKTGEKLTTAEGYFIETTPIPVNRLLQEFAMAGVGESLIPSMSEAISFEYVLHYLESLTELMTRASGNILQKDQMDSERFYKSVEKTRDSLRDQMSKLKFSGDIMLQFLNIRETLKSTLSSHIQQTIQVE